MIRKIERYEIEECVKVIRKSFSTVANEFNITEQNCPTHTSFIKPEKLYFQFDKNCPMYILIEDKKIIGYFSLIPQKDGSAELNNLAVLPQYRHNGYGKEMLKYAVKTAKAMKFNKIKIGIIEESAVLKNWYIKNGFVHTGTQKFEHLPFTVGFMEYYIGTKGEKMTEVKFCDNADDEKLKYAVIAAKHNGKWVLCKHKERDTYEIPGGHREPGETILEAAKRELYEETGAVEFDITPICFYKVEDYGMLYYAEIYKFGKLPDFEMEYIYYFDDLPDELTYPFIQPALFEKAAQFLKKQ